MKKTILVPISNGTEETEAVTIIDLLRRAGNEVIVAGDNELITCSRGVKIVADSLLSDYQEYDELDAIVIPGGSVGIDRLLENEQLAIILPYNFKRGILIGAICAAPLLLAKHKILVNNLKFTCSNSVKVHLIDYNYIDQNLVIDKNVMTSKALGTSIPFVLKIIETLNGIELATKIAKEIIYQGDF